MSKIKYQTYAIENFKIVTTNFEAAKDLYSIISKEVKAQKPNYKAFYWFVIREITGIHAEPIEKPFFDSLVSAYNYKKATSRVVLALDTLFHLVNRPVTKIIRTNKEYDVIEIIQFNKTPSHWAAFEHEGELYVLKYNKLPIRNTKLRKIAHNDTVPNFDYTLIY